MPIAVRDEVLRDDPNLPGIGILRRAFAEDWLKVKPVATSSPAEDIFSSLGAWETEAIALMKEMATDVLLTDERRGRIYASREGLPVLGTIGLLRLAREHGTIPAVTPLLEQLRMQGFRISADILEHVRQEEVPRP